MMKFVIHIVTDVTILVTEASHIQLARITTVCLTRSGVVSATRMPYLNTYSTCRRHLSRVFETFSNRTVSYVRMFAQGLGFFVLC
jgi:hypothetical protein